jgi:hypothetical protein
MNLIDHIDDGKIPYGTILKRAVIRSVETHLQEDVKAIIGVRGREDFLYPTITSLQDAGITHITIVEYAHELQHEHTCRWLDVNYVGVKCDESEMYNRSLAFNIGAIIAGDCEWLLTHDIDCMVQRTFLRNVLLNTLNKNLCAVQTFNKRRVLYCNEKLSDMLINQPELVNDLSEKSDGVFTCKGKAPGGSIFLSRSLFMSIGGYDPELFTGYAPEDRMFWDKMSCLCEVGSCDNPVTDIFHLHHQFMGNTNPKLNEMITMTNHFESLSRQEKMKIVEYKSKILSRWMS